MDNITFIVEQKRYTGPSQVVSVRLPKDMLKDLDAAANATGRTRSDIISMGLEFALQHMEIRK